MNAGAYGGEMTACAGALQARVLVPEDGESGPLSGEDLRLSAIAAVRIMTTAALLPEIVSPFRSVCPDPGDPAAIRQPGCTS